MKTLEFKKESKGLYKSTYNGLEITLSNYASGKWELSIVDDTKTNDDEYLVYNEFSSSKKSLLKLVNSFFNLKK